MDARTTKSFDTAIDTVKQILALSTAVLTLTATIFRDVLRSPSGATWLVVAALAFSFISVLGGCLAVMAITSNLAADDIADDELTIKATNIRAAATLQVLCFAVSLGLLLTFALRYAVV
jgi:hypothetical protein